MVQYHCKSCGEDHPAPVPFAEKLYFDSAATIELSFQCPTTGDSRRYNKTDLTWRDEDVHEPVGSYSYL